MRNFKKKLIYIFIFSVVPSLCFSKAEFGFGPLFIRAPHYRGANQYGNHILPMPYFSYKTATFEADSSFLKQLLFSNDLFEFKVSLSAGLNVNSKDNDARAGMPGLDYTVEAGPLLVIKLHQTDSSNVSIDLPARRTFHTDLKTRFRDFGTYIVPHLNLNVSEGSFYFETTAAVMWGSKGFHSYFYNVEEQYVTSERAYYEARAGYSGWHATAMTKFNLSDHLKTMIFIRHDQLQNVAFHESPLFMKEHYTLWGVGLFYVF